MARPTKRVRIYSALEAANLCGVVNQTAINWIKGGHLKAFLTPGGQYRIYAEDLIQFLHDRSMRIPPQLAEQGRDDMPADAPDWSSILIVDDDEILNGLLRRVIARRLPTHTIFQAFDGFEAGRLIAEKRPGHILLDVNLPGVDGRAICRRIKQDPAFGKPFIVAMTGLDEAEVRDAMLAEGADAFFSKPFDMDELVRTVESFIAMAAGNAHQP